MTATTAEPEARPADEAGTTRAGLVIGVLVVAAFVMILNETILSVALHDLTIDLGVSTSTVQWLTSGFLLTMAVVIPVTGFLLERFTPRQIFVASMTLFSLGTLISGLAPGFEILLVGRVVQACGTAVMIPLLMTSIMRLVAPEKRGATMGTITIVIAVAPAVGPTIGGAVLAYLGWRWMFFVVLPLAIIALVLGAVSMRLPTETRSVPLDVFSVVLSAIGFGGILYGFSSIGESGGGQLPPWLPIVVGAVVLAGFVVRQLSLQRRERALLDLRPFTYRRYVVSLLIVALLFMALLGAGAILLPLYLQTVLHADTFTTGLAVLPGGLVLGLLGRPVGRLYDRVGARPLVIPGALAMAVALWLFATVMNAGSSIWLVVVPIHILLMAGLGLMMSPLMTESLSSLPGPLYSHGSAILATLQQVAGAFGTALFVTISAVAAANPNGVPDAAGLRVGFMAAGLVGVIALVVSLFTSGKAAPEVATVSSPVESEIDPDTVPVGPTPDAGAVGPAGSAGAAGALGTADAGWGPPETAAPATTSPGGRAPVRATASDAVREPARATTSGADGAQPQTVDTAGATSTLRGHVDTAGRAAAVITLVDTNGQQRGHARSVDGAYELDVPGPGTWYVIVSGPGSRPSADRIVVGSGAVVLHDVTLRPAATPDHPTDTRPFARPGAGHR